METSCGHIIALILISARRHFKTYNQPDANRTGEKQLESCLCCPFEMLDIEDTLGWNFRLLQTVVLVVIVSSTSSAALAHFHNLDRL